MAPKTGEVAEPFTRVTGDPMFVPVPCGHPVVVFEQSWNCTVPVTVPCDPLRCAVSVSVLPAVTVVELTWVAPRQPPTRRW